MCFKNKNIIKSTTYLFILIMFTGCSSGTFRIKQVGKLGPKEFNTRQKVDAVQMIPFIWDTIEISALDCFCEGRILIGSNRGDILVWDQKSGKHKHYNNLYDNLSKFNVVHDNYSYDLDRRVGMLDVKIDKEKNMCWQYSGRHLASFRYQLINNELIFDRYRTVLEVPELQTIIPIFGEYARIMAGHRQERLAFNVKALTKEIHETLKNKLKTGYYIPFGVGVLNGKVVYSFYGSSGSELYFVKNGEKTNEFFFEGVPRRICREKVSYKAYHRNTIISSQFNRLLMVVVPNGIVHLTKEEKVITYPFPKGYDYQVNDIQECADGSLVASLGKQGGLFRLKAEAIERQSSKGEDDWLCLKKKGAYDLAVTEKGTIYYANKSTVYKMDLDGKVTKCTEINSLRKKLCK